MSVASPTASLQFSFGDPYTYVDTTHAHAFRSAPAANENGQHSNNVHSTQKSLGGAAAVHTPMAASRVGRLLMRPRRRAGAAPLLLAEDE